MMDGMMGGGMMAGGAVAMILHGVLVVLAVAALVKYLMR